MTVFKCTINDSTLIDENIESLLGYIRSELQFVYDNASEDLELDISIKVHEMSREDLDALPEFEGF